MLKSSTWTVAIVVAAVSVVGAADRAPLIEAARNANRVAVQALLLEEADVNAAEGDGTTALHWASYRDDVEVADLLIRAGANVNAANDLGATPLWAASENASAPMVARLLAVGADPNLALILGETPLMVASRTGNPLVAEQLLKARADPNRSGARGQTALMWAVAQQHPGIVALLLAHGADVHARSDEWSQVMAVAPHGHPDYNRAIPQGGNTALLFAARVGNLESARLLIAADANVNDEDAWGVSATVLAAHSKFEDLLDLLLAEGADANAADAGFSALHAAIMHRSARMVRALVVHGADVNAPLRTWTPTRRSSRDFNFEPTLVGASPFWLAARFTEPGLMRFLAEHGADPRFVHHADYVAGENHQHRTEVLTTLMAAVGITASPAWVALDRSGREARTLETVKLALELGADINAVNTDGRTVLDAAWGARLPTVVTFLTESGAMAGPGR